MTERRSQIAQDRAARAQAEPKLPEGWVPCLITYEGDEPEEVAFGPQRMMDRLKKWLTSYFEHVYAERYPAARAQAEPVAWMTPDGMSVMTPDEKANMRTGDPEDDGFADRHDVALVLATAARAQGAGEAVASSQDAEMLHGAREVIRIWNKRARKFGFDGVAGMLNAFRHGEAVSTAPTIPQAAEVPVTREHFELVPVPKRPSCCDRGRNADGTVSDECCGNGACNQDFIEKRAAASWLAAAPTPTASAVKAEGEGEAAKARCDAQDALYAKAGNEWQDIWLANGRDNKTPHEWFAIGVEWAATQPPSEANRTREGGDVVAAKLAMIEHPFLLTWGEELAKTIEGNHVISGGNGPNWIDGWETANSCAADLVRLRVQQATFGTTTSEGASHG